MSSKTKNIKIFAIIAGIVLAGLAITFGFATMFVASLEQKNDSQNPQTIFWQHIHGLGVNPEDRTILYIATHGDFYHSENGSPPIKVDEKRADYMAFSPPPKPGYPLYSSGHPETGGNTGLIQSTDGGKTWQLVSNVKDSPVDFHAMAVSKMDPNTIIGFDAGTQELFKTTDGGKTWKTLPITESVSSLAFSPFDSNVIMAGTSKGIFSSDNGGNSWSNIGSYKKLNVLALAFDDDARLFASVDTFGLVSSSDFGESWNDLGGIDLTITSIAADSQSQVIYVSGYSPYGYQEVYRLSYDLDSIDLIGTNKVLK